MTTPKYPVIVLSAVLALSGCSGSTEPEFQAPPTGTYDYTFHAVRGDDQTYDYSGTLHITFSSETQMQGSWDVPEYGEAIELGGWDADAEAYILVADLDDEARHTRGKIWHSISYEDGEWRCIGDWIFSWDSAGSDYGSGTCTVG